MQDSLSNAGGARPAQDDEPIAAISADRLADILRRAGYRVTAAEQNGAVQLMSASQGIGFSVRFGNPAAGLGPRPADAGEGPAAALYVDYTLACLLQVQGELPAELVANWNRTKRFARLANHGPLLALEMDVIVAGGVCERHVRSTIELWDRLIQEFLLHLRNRPAMTEQEAAARAAPGEQAAQAAHERAAQP
ncbi:YbjN domain-containing protein [Burkholderia humptydooensis]|uniref:YbjN domain-containing protein n=3 Tax=Burkholderia humptydooensis TaxID=430531 RepID=A0A7U4P413_9BURK|nr:MULTISPECIES: YbjN domain-containing protein [Burkholderia]AJY41581.1 bacterial sensory transduction regulator family protein [Burkholderia sp. 2002721687]ALX42577.1 bacterial sensory transduction regulator family protein [Burkholderia humptydooensis]EIP87865.1 hypothetical protein A33K_15886 [Burkholderia humptydooensis MSMB43]QPS42204.1 YbjN domain-containing protein [Burkholderia humptydooensis]